MKLESKTHKNAYIVLSLIYEVKSPSISDHTINYLGDIA